MLCFIWTRGSEAECIISNIARSMGYTMTTARDEGMVLHSVQLVQVLLATGSPLQFSSRQFAVDTTVVQLTTHRNSLRLHTNDCVRYCLVWYVQYGVMTNSTNTIVMSLKITRNCISNTMNTTTSLLTFSLCFRLPPAHVEGFNGHDGRGSYCITCPENRSLNLPNLSAVGEARPLS